MKESKYGQYFFILKINKLIKIICCVLILSICVPFASCGNENDSSEDRVSIVCTAFPQYDFVKNIISGKEECFEIVYLFDNGADVHSFQTDVDFKAKIKIIESDIFIYNGGESDSWVQNILDDNSMNKECKAISLVEMVDEEFLVFPEEHNHNSENEKNESEIEHNHSENADEHVWLSLKNAALICEAITDIIISFDFKNENVYNNNLENYLEKINSLNVKAESEFKTIESPYVLLADRFPFVYLFRDYNIEYNSAFSGCSSETEATYENIIKLCKVIEERDVDTIFVLEKSNSNVSESIISSSQKDIKVLKINSMQSVSRKEIENGLNYYEMMKRNIETLLESMKK